MASEQSFEAAIGPLWLQALAAYAAPTPADGAISSGGSSNDCERRVILNCEVLNLSTDPSHSAFNISLGLSNGEHVFHPNQRLRSTLCSAELTLVLLLQLAAHVVVVAIGVAPAVPHSFFRGALVPEFAEDGGISVDARMQSSVSHVLAAGDCCTLRQTHSRHWFQMRLWEQAAVMGALQPSFTTTSASSRVTLCLQVQRLRV